MENNKTPSSYLVRTNLMIVWYYFFTNNTPKIEAIVTELQQTELDKSGKLYLKIIELIQYFLMQELEMVETWISNISQYTRYNKVDNIALQEFVKLFRKVMYWKSKHYFDNEELPAKLQQNIAQKYQAYAINDFYSLPLAWLYFYVMEGTKS